MPIWLIVIIVLVVLILLWFVGVYNALIQLRNKVRNQFSQIDIQLKKRYDLIPNLVETVKGYAKHENETFKEVVEARNKFNTASTPEEEMAASGELTSALNRLMVLAESYPELKANENFLSLQADLKDCEEKIAYARQFYNDSVLSYMNKVQMFPSNIIASMFGFKEMKYFEVAEGEKAAPKVTF